MFYYFVAYDLHFYWWRINGVSTYLQIWNSNVMYFCSNPCISKWIFNSNVLQNIEIEVTANCNFDWLVGFLIFETKREF